MAFYPTKGPTIKCKHPHPHNHLHRHDGCYHDGCTRAHCSNVTCEKKSCCKGNHRPHPHQHCNFDEDYCAYNRYKTYHGHMHIDPCNHSNFIQTAPVYNYDYNRNAYVPSHRVHNGLVLNIDYAIKTTINVDIAYENGEHLIGEISEGYKYDFIYVDSGVLKRDVGILTSIRITNGTISDSRLGFANPTNVATIYLYFDCSAESRAHTIVVDLNLLRSISIVKDEIIEDDVYIDDTVTDDVEDTTEDDTVTDDETSTDDNIEDESEDTEEEEESETVDSIQAGVMTPTLACDCTCAEPISDEELDAIFQEVSGESGE